LHRFKQYQRHALGNRTHHKSRRTAEQPIRSIQVSGKSHIVSELQRRNSLGKNLALRPVTHDE
jgi:hypothetical protein